MPLRRALAALLLATTTACSQAPAPPPVAARPMIGVNTSVNCRPENSTYSLANVLKAASGWRPRDWGGPDYPTDASGGLRLPAGEVATIRMHYGAPDYPLGDYVVEFEGDGDFASADMAPLPASRGRFVARADKVSPFGMEIRCTRSNPANPVRLKAIWSPGYAGSNKTFRDEYVAGLKGYAILRFVDDLAINRSTPGEWARRTKPSDARWNPDLPGVSLPIEACVELCNRVGAHFWYELPHLADDEYVRQAAKLIKATLDPKLKVYVERSNEVWNWAFAQAQWQKDKYAPGTVKPEDNNFWGQTNWLPWRSVEDFKLFEAEFGPAGRPRIVEVMPSQTSWGDRSRFLLSKAREFRGGAKPCDAIAIAPYFGAPEKYKVDDRFSVAPEGFVPGRPETLDPFMAELGQVIDTRIAQDIRWIKEVADEFGVRLIAYEGGQHLTPDSEATRPVVAAANRHPAMAAIYRAYLATWFREGGSEFVHYAEQGSFSGGWGWGIKEGPYSTLDQSPKLQGLRAAQAAFKLAQVGTVPAPARASGPPPAAEAGPSPYDKILDHGDAGYAESGSWLSWDGGHKDSHRYHQGGDGTRSRATFTATGLVAGEYQVQASWAGDAGHASRAKYTIRVDGKVVATAEANQKVSSDGGPPAGNFAFGPVASFRAGAGSTVVVELSGNADGDVVADAVRIVCTKATAGPARAPSPAPARPSNAVRRPAPAPPASRGPGPSRP